MIQAILLAKVILKKIVPKFIWYLSQYTDILNELLVLVMAVTFISGNLKGLSDGKINSIKTSNHNITPNLKKE